MNLASLLFKEIYDEKTDSFELELASINSRLKNCKSKYLYVRGLFQNFKYFDHLTDSDIKLKEPSDSCNKFFVEMSYKDPLVIHLRLGDYFNTNLGILSSKYYEEAIICLEKHSKHKEIWIITNDVKKATEILQPILDARFKFDVNYEIKDPAELLMIMSRANSLIISNSTLSLWAAKLANPICRVIYPKNFYKNKSVPQNNFKDSWKAIESDWLIQ